MTNDEFRRITPRDGDPAAAEPDVRSVVNPPKSAGPSRKTVILGSLVVGGIAGAAILGPLSTLAASPSPAASGAATSPTETTAPTATSTPAASDDNEATEPQGRGGHTEAVSDASVVAKAIGISEADLLTALGSGQTAAQVATAHGVPVQTVVDALVADGESELAAEVASGQITQAQADAEKAEVTQRATDQVNGSLGKGGHGPDGGRGGHIEAVSDASVVAKAIGISEADLLTALSSGQTAAQVATAHGVPVQTVIDALVADGESELAAEVASGQITQAQADAEKAEVTQRATDQVNGSLRARH